MSGEASFRSDRYKMNEAVHMSTPAIQCPLGTLAMTCATTTISCAITVASASHCILLGIAMLTVSALSYYFFDTYISDTEGKPSAAESGPEISIQEIRAGAVAWSLSITKNGAFKVNTGLYESPFWMLDKWVLDPVSGWAVGTTLAQPVATVMPWISALLWGLAAVPLVLFATKSAQSVGMIASLLRRAKASCDSQVFKGGSGAAMMGCALAIMSASRYMLLGNTMIVMTVAVHALTLVVKKAVDNESKSLNGRLWKFQFHVSAAQVKRCALTLAITSLMGCLLYAACAWAPIVWMFSKIGLAAGIQVLRHPAVLTGVALLAAAALGACTAFIEDQETADASSSPQREAV